VKLSSRRRTPRRKPRKAPQKPRRALVRRQEAPQENQPGEANTVMFGEEASLGGDSSAAIEEGRSHAEGLPIDEYDSLTVSQVTQSLKELSLEEVEQLRYYEAENRNRRSIMQRFETRIRAARKNLEKKGDAETEESSGE
jgi:hypothetical protein